MHQMEWSIPLTIVIPLLGWFKGKAHEYGLSQDEFDGLINEYAQADLQRGPDWNVESEPLVSMQKID